MKNSFIRALTLGLVVAFPMSVLAQQAGGDKPAAEKKEKKTTKKAKDDTGAAPAEGAEKTEKTEKKTKKSKADKAAGEGAAKP